MGTRVPSVLLESSHLDKSQNQDIRYTYCPRTHEKKKKRQQQGAWGKFMLGINTDPFYLHMAKSNK